MPIISTVGRKSRGCRALIACMYTTLALGAVTMVYPFVLMLSTSLTSEVDSREYRIVPRYLYDDAALYRKYIESKYNEDIVRYNAWFGTDLASFAHAEPPKHVRRRFVEEWRSFVTGLPNDYLMLCHSASIGDNRTPEMLTRYRKFVAEKFRSNLDLLNATYHEANENWTQLTMPLEDWTQRNFSPVESAKYRDFLEFKRRQPLRYLITPPIDGLYRDYLKMKYGNLTNSKRALVHSPKDAVPIRLTTRVPHSPAARLWEDFVRRECPVRYIRFNSAADSPYRQFIRRKYGNEIAVSSAHGIRIPSLDMLSVPRTPPNAGTALVDWIEFLQKEAPVESIELTTPEALFRTHLARKYKHIEVANKKLGTSFESFDAVAPPYAENDLLELREHRWAIRREFLVRNYREVMDYIILHGRALLNTGILCVGIVLTSLTVNPLCAYAMSRFNLRATYKILLFLLATMAFPAEVSAIPSFLLVKKLHLLGTYWAIILPGMANGFSIFLLKGFFDGLPKELYEAAIIDGATEMQMFRNITLQLSKPILAVIALGAFTGAYGSFMWAFLVCQDQKMWTLMVWLYQMQIWSPPPVVYASLVVAAIPTLLVFICCQNVIMRGIIVPTEK